MNLGSFIAALKSAAAHILISFSTAFLSGLGTVGAHFLQSEKEIGAKCLQTFHDELDKAKTGGMDDLNAIEHAATITLQVFCDEEGKEFSLECAALITLAKSSAQSAAGL